MIPLIATAKLQISTQLPELLIKCLAGKNCFFKVWELRVSFLVFPEGWIAIASDGGEIYTFARDEGSNEISTYIFVLNNYELKLFLCRRSQ